MSYCWDNSLNQIFANCFLISIHFFFLVYIKIENALGQVFVVRRLQKCILPSNSDNLRRWRETYRSEQSITI